MPDSSAGGLSGFPQPGSCSAAGAVRARVTKPESVPVRAGRTTDSALMENDVLGLDNSACCPQLFLFPGEFFQKILPNHEGCSHNFQHEVDTWGIGQLCSGARGPQLERGFVMRRIYCTVLHYCQSQSVCHTGILGRSWGGGGVTECPLSPKVPERKNQSLSSDCSVSGG